MATRNEDEMKVIEAEDCMKAAVKAVSNIKKGQINELKCLRRPPKLVEFTLGAVAIVIDKNIKDWKATQKMLSKNFLPTLLKFKTSTIVKKNRQKLEKEFLSNEEFNFEKVNRTSKVCGALVLWVRAQIKLSYALEAKQRIKTIKKEPEIKTLTLKKQHNDDIVNELVNVGVGSRDLCIAASFLVVNPNDINEVREKVLELQNQNQNQNHYTDDEKASDGEMSSFENQINQLLNIIKNHFKFMSKQEKTVNQMIAGSGQQQNKLQNAKMKALQTEKKLLREIMNITSLNDFLTNIILIENLFNYEYAKQGKSKQEAARNKYAKNISMYEKKSKPICNTLSFVDLLFQAYTDLTAFKDWLKILQSECDKENIKMISKPEAKQKNIERAFYKTFYVYAIEHGNKAHQSLTDVLRCSLVFDSFDDLYQCFAIIEKLSKENGGILRCKDRFHPVEMAFGYRDLLLNINCPQSQGIVVCEVQLHHQLFYKHKNISHAMYKKARLFEDKYGNNLAYQYADKYIRNNVGDKRYEYNDEKQDELDPVQLLKEWKLSQYAEILIDDEGYDDPELWKDVCEEELKQMGFKAGHAKKFIKKSANL